MAASHPANQDQAESITVSHFRFSGHDLSHETGLVCAKFSSIITFFNFLCRHAWRQAQSTRLS